MAPANVCTECGAVAPGPDGLCKGCRIRETQGEEAYREHMANLGRRGAWAANAKRTTAAPCLDEEELGPLETHEDAKRRLDLVCRAVLTGRVRDKEAQAAIRAIEAWLKAEGEQGAAAVYRDLEAEISKLKGAIAEGERERMRAL